MEYWGKKGDCAQFNHLSSSDMSDEDCVMESGGKEMTVAQETQMEETNVEEMETQIDETHMEDEKEERHVTKDTASDEVPSDITDADTAAAIPEPIAIASTASENEPR